MKGHIGRILVMSSILALVTVGLIPAVAQASTQEDRVPRSNEGVRPTQITAGDTYTCALTPAGDAICWGDNSAGQAPALVAGPFVQITAGMYHTCALTPGGNAACWGENGNGQAPALVTGPFTQLTAGEHHTCALTPAGNVTCWGGNGNGQAPASVSGPFTQIAAGWYHTCALTPAGNATCWGYNSDGQAPASVSGPFTQIAAASMHTCALTVAGNAACWGVTSSGQAPASVTGPFTQIAAGGYHTCALTPAGSVACWGENSWGQAPAALTGPFTQITGGNSHTCALTPVGNVACLGWNHDGQAPASVSGPFGGPAIAAGGNFACALTPAGDAICWGANEFGQAPALVPGPFTQITAGGFHTCALTPAGAATCWGFNASGQADFHAGPFTQLTAGGFHTCALTLAGNATCWGYNNYGQAPPAGVSGPFTQITAGEYHTCALTPAGDATCWGDNGDGRAPASVTGPFTQVTAGGFHTCALTPVGNATCWGWNEFGTAPALVTGPFTQITAGYLHACALTPVGNAACWGVNDEGQALASVIGPFTQITAGRNSNCALTPTGNPTCWGWNIQGQLGGPPSISGFPTDGAVGGAYDFSFGHGPSGGMEPDFAITGGSLPPGLDMSVGGKITGVPTTVGTYEFDVTATSLFKPDATKSRDITIVPVPDTSIDTSPSDPSNSASAVFGYSSNVVGSDFECDLDGGGFSPCGAGGKTYGLLADGPHTFSVRATIYGATDASPATYTWTVDATGPTTTILSGPSGIVTETTAEFTFTSSEAATFRCSLDGAPYVACTSPVSYPGLADGPHSFRVEAKDGVGNTGSDAIRTWQIGPLPHLPDGMIKLSTISTYLGGGIYNTTGAGQTAAKTIRLGATAIFSVNVHNDGTHPDQIALKGCASAPGFTVTYKVGRLNVTAPVVAGTYQTPTLAVGAAKIITAKIRASSALARGATLTCTLTARSVGDATRTDVVNATATVP